MPERPKGAVCKIAGVAYGGSNPPPPTDVMSRDTVPTCLETSFHVLGPSVRLVVAGRIERQLPDQLSVFSEDPDA